MKAVRLEKDGRLNYSDVDMPENIEADEVLLKVDMTGICYRDILTVDGFFPNTKFPVTLGHEITGKVVKKGNSVSEFEVGERVASLIYEPCGKCEECLAGRENLCRRRKTFGEDIDGSYAEYVKVNQRALVKVPQQVNSEGAAIAACVTGMLVHAFKKRGNLQSDETVLVTGAGGGVGVHAVQIAKALGANVIAATSSSWKADAIKKYGADHVIVYNDKFSDQVKQITDGKGVDLVLDSVGTPTLQDSIRSSRWGGRVVLVGNVKPEPIDIMLGILILRENTIMGSLSSTREDVKVALDMTAKGLIKPVIHQVFSLADAEKGHDVMRNKSSLGRILLRP
ncbi:MAG: alcohol dehydrogenase catalytic domain-containing protein [Conexivisphaerales archaeon]